jgi:hypothetical protein
MSGIGRHDGINRSPDDACMNPEIMLKPGDQVCARSTGRSLLVRGVEGQLVHCAWFDGRHYREVILPLEAVRLSRGTSDDRLVGVY